MITGAKLKDRKKKEKRQNLVVPVITIIIIFNWKAQPNAKRRT